MKYLKIFILIQIAFEGLVPSKAFGIPQHKGSALERPFHYSDQETGAANVILVEKKYYLYDLYEFGLHLRKPLKPVEDRMGISIKLADMLPKKLITEPQVFNSIVYILNSIYDKSPEVAEEIMGAWKSYNNWYYIDDDITNIHDIDSSPRNKEQIHTILFRDDKKKFIVIEKPVFNLLPYLHKAALFFHEAFYILSKDKSSSDHARYFTSFIFQENFSKVSYEKFIEQYAHLTQKNKSSFLTKKQWDHLSTKKYRKACSQERKKLQYLAVQFHEAFHHYISQILKINFKTKQPLKAYLPNGGDVLEYDLTSSVVKRLPPTLLYFSIDNIDLEISPYNIRVPQNTHLHLTRHFFYDSKESSCLLFDVDFMVYFEKIRDQAKKQKQFEKDNLMGRCFVKKDLKVINNLKTLQIFKEKIIQSKKCSQGELFHLNPILKQFGESNGP